MGTQSSMSCNSAFQPAVCAASRSPSPPKNILSLGSPSSLIAAHIKMTGDGGQDDTECCWPRDVIFFSSFPDTKWPAPFQICPGRSDRGHLNHCWSLGNETLDDANCSCFASSGEESQIGRVSIGSPLQCSPQSHKLQTQSRKPPNERRRDEATDCAPWTKNFDNLVFMRKRSSIIEFLRSAVHVSRYRKDDSRIMPARKRERSSVFFLQLIFSMRRR